jgi:hypothetical protein
MIIGACIEGIGSRDNAPQAPAAPGSFLRAKGFGSEWLIGENAGKMDNRYPHWNATD